MICTHDDFGIVAFLEESPLTVHSSEFFAVNFDGDAYGQYMSYDFTGVSTNSRGAHSYFGENVTWPDNYKFECDVMLKAAENPPGTVPAFTSADVYTFVPS